MSLFRTLRYKKIYKKSCTIHLSDMKNVMSVASAARVKF